MDLEKIPDLLPGIWILIRMEIHHTQYSDRFTGIIDPAFTIRREITRCSKISYFGDDGNEILPVTCICTIYCCLCSCIGVSKSVWKWNYCQRHLVFPRWIRRLLCYWQPEFNAIPIVEGEIEYCCNLSYDGYDQISLE